MSNLHEVKNAIKNINDFIAHAGSTPARLELHKGNQTTGVTHKVIIYTATTGVAHRTNAQRELFRTKTLSDMLQRLIGFEEGLKSFRLFRQR